MYSRETAELARLVGDAGDTRPAEVELTQPPLLHWRTDGGADRGSLTQIQGYYQQLRRGRLVVQGPAGAGKTVLAIALARDLNAAFIHTTDSISGRDSQQNPSARVAVRVSASSFDPGGGFPPDQQRTWQVAARLRAWLINHLCTVYGLRKRDAVGLVIGGWLLPVIDGVDEMDPAEQPPRRAAALLAALNHPTGEATTGGLAPVVLTCRADRYIELAVPFPTSRSIDRAGHGDEGREVLQDATVVQVEPLSPTAVRDYLLFRFPDPEGTGEGQPRWRPILTKLATPAASDIADQGEDVLVDALRSPLRLFLVIDGYRDPATDPAELIGCLDAASLDAYLFARLIPAATRLHPHPNGSSYRPAQIHTWLVTLAYHLAHEDRAGGSGTDLFLHELWRTAGRRLPRFLAAVILTLAIAAPLLWLGITIDPNVPIVTFIVVVFVVETAWVIWWACRIDIDLRRLDLRLLRSRLGLWRIVGGVALSLVMAFVMWLAFGFAFGFTEGFASEFAAVLVSGLVLASGFGFTQRPQAIESPRQLVAQGLTYTTAAVIGGLAMTLAGTFVPALAFGLATAVSVRLAPGLAFGLAFGLVLGPARSPWPRYLVACLLLGCRGLLPWRPAVFLDWAYQAGMLRIAGVAVQFRHREFQEWLTIGGQLVAAPTGEHWVATSGSTVDPTTW